MNTYQAPANASSGKKATLLSADKYLIPGRVRSFNKFGIDLVIGEREGYRFKDVDGAEFMDFHLNGGTFNLGHRNPEIASALCDAMGHLDIGNHHFPSPYRSELAEKLALHSPGQKLHYTVFTSSGSEANDVAIKSARFATGRRKIVALDSAYHGRTGLSGAVGDPSIAQFFNSDYPEECLTAPFNDVDAMEAVLKNEDVAAVIMEIIPATYGFPVPADHYLPEVKALCEKYGTLFIADEVQTGMGRTGSLWGVERWNVEPDILVTGKGLSGGMYPIAAAVMSESVGSWLIENGWGHVSTFGGSEIGCVAALQALDICSNPATLKQANEIAEHMVQGLTDIQSRHSYLKEIRHTGLVMGLEFDSPNGGINMMKALYDQGVWAIFAGFDSAVLQWKPGLLIDKAYCDEALNRFESAISVAENIKDDAEKISIAPEKK